MLQVGFSAPSSDLVPRAESAAGSDPAKFVAATKFQESPERCDGFLQFMSQVRPYAKHEEICETWLRSST